MNSVQQLFRGFIPQRGRPQEKFNNNNGTGLTNQPSGTPLTYRQAGFRRYSKKNQKPKLSNNDQQINLSKPHPNTPTKRFLDPTHPDFNTPRFNSAKFETRNNRYDTPRTATPSQPSSSEKIWALLGYGTGGSRTKIRRKRNTKKKKTKRKPKRKTKRKVRK